MKTLTTITQHCASTAAHWLFAGSISVPVVEGFVGGFKVKYAPSNGLEIDRMAEVRG